MTRLLSILLAGLVLAVTGAAVAGGIDDNRSALASTTSTTGDVRGPCDEAEHRSDPRCTGTQAKRDDARKGRRGKADRVKQRKQRRDDRGRDRRERRENRRGPCDEAEHANDDRCTGADDHRGGREGDRSGSNSGPG